MKILLDKLSFRNLLWCIIGCIIFGVAGIAIGSNTLICVYLFIIGVHNLDFDKVLRFCRDFMAIGTILIVILAIVGIVPNWYYTIGGRERYAMGFYYPSHLSSCFFYISIASLYLSKSKFKFSNLIFWEIANLVIYEFTNSRAAFYLLAAVYVIFYLIKYINPVKNKKISSAIKNVSLISFPVCSIVSFIACYFYDGTGLLSRVDSVLNGRIRLGHEGLMTYGIHLFGQDITWIGNGGQGFINRELTGSYNFVDNSYVKILLDYGLIVLIFIIIGFTLAIYQCAKKDNLYFCIALCMVAVYSIIEPRLLEFGFNPFILCLCSYIGVINAPDLRKLPSFDPALE